MADALTGTATTPDKLTGSTTLQFREVPVLSTFKYTGTGTPSNSNVGDVESYTADLFDSNNVLVGTKDISDIYFKREKNGDVIGNLNEIFHLKNGEVFTHGTFDQAKFLQGSKPIEANIIGGTDTYSNLTGTETIINLRTSTPGEVSTTLSFKS